MTADDLPQFSLTSFELRSKESPSNSADKTVVAECPEDKVAASGYFFVEGAEGFVAVSESRQVSPPLTPVSSWSVKAVEVNGGTAEPWKLTVFAQCATVSGVSG